MLATSCDAQTFCTSTMKNAYVVVNNTKQTMPNAGFVELITAVLARGASFRFKANGSSMFPFIRDDDVIIVEPTPVSLRLGEVVAFVNPRNDRLTVHRIVQMNRHKYLIRGDNVLAPDGYVQHSDILGRIICAERGNRGVRFGLGFERVVIAFLSLHGWLKPLLEFVESILYSFFKRRAK
jgi:hypothetical protein